MCVNRYFYIIKMKKNFLPHFIYLRIIIRSVSIIIPEIKINEENCADDHLRKLAAQMIKNEA